MDARLVLALGFPECVLFTFSPKYDLITGLENKTKRPVRIQEALQSRFQKGSWQFKEGKGLMW